MKVEGHSIYLTRLSLWLTGYFIDVTVNQLESSYRYRWTTTGLYLVTDTERILVVLYGDRAARRHLWCLSAETKSPFTVRCLFVLICWRGTYWCILFCRTIQDPSSQILKWRAAPKTVLVIKKIWDDVVDEPFVQLASWLVQVSQGYWPTIPKVCYS